MRFGICTPVENAAAVKAAGWEFVEESVQGLFQGLLPDPEWTGLTRAQSSALPVPAANMLVPGNLKITGPEVDSHRLKHYMTHVRQRANKTNTRTLVFGSGGARQVPDG